MAIYVTWSWEKLIIMEMLDGMCWHHSLIYYCPEFLCAIKTKLYYCQVNFFTNYYTREGSDQKGRQKVFSCSKTPKSIVWELSAGRGPRFPRTSSCETLQLVVAVIVWLFPTLCAQFVADVCIFNSLAVFDPNHCSVEPLASFCRILLHAK